MGAEGTQKGAQIGAPEEEQNRALAAARAQSSMSEDTQNGTSKTGLVTESTEMKPAEPKRALQEAKLAPKGTLSGQWGALAARVPQP